MVARDLYEKGLEKMKSFSLQPALMALRYANEGAVNDVKNINGCAYYQFLPGLIEIVKPKQIVELGGAMGVSTLMMLQSNYQDFKLYSITLPEHGLEFSYIQDNYPNLTKVIGNDLDLSLWPVNDLKETDLWFFDSEHTKEQLTRELDLYSQFIKKGAVVLFDDIHLNDGMQEVWDALRNGKWGKWDCFDATDPLHYSGFGICKA